MIRSESLAYGASSQHLGHIAYDDNLALLPVVLVIPDWSGRNPTFCQIAEKLASWGYLGFALDLYGDAYVGNSTDENTQLMQPFIEDRSRITAHAQSALDAITKLPQVDPKRIAVIGFCFGGLVALDMARACLPIQCIISFHGLLFPPNQSKSETIQSRILICHGYSDPMVTPDSLQNFCQEMDARQALWEVNMYGHVKHAFSNVHANDPTLGTLYNEEASARSWQSAKDFLSRYC